MNITVFTDGSSRGNPGPGGWGAIVRTHGQVEELGGREDHTTNNRMELSAALGALAYIRRGGMEGSIVLQTDSKYVIQGITAWVKGWQKNGWITTSKKEVINRDLWEALDLAAKGFSIEWRYVKGHAGHPGNERCDEIATSFADDAPVDLYRGPVDRYRVDIDAPAAASSPSKSKSSSAKAYSYLSLLDGTLMVHKTWAECEKRVKGARGAKFKKSISPENEREIRREWGI